MTLILPSGTLRADSKSPTRAGRAEFIAEADFHIFQGTRSVAGV